MADVNGIYTRIWIDLSTLSEISTQRAIKLCEIISEKCIFTPLVCLWKIKDLNLAKIIIISLYRDLRPFYVLNISFEDAVELWRDISIELKRIRINENTMFLFDYSEVRSLSKKELFQVFIRHDAYLKNLCILLEGEAQNLRMKMFDLYYSYNVPVLLHITKSTRLADAVDLITDVEKARKNCLIRFLLGCQFSPQGCDVLNESLFITMDGDAYSCINHFFEKARRLYNMFDNDIGLTEDHHANSFCKRCHCGFSSTCSKCSHPFPFSNEEFCNIVAQLSKRGSIRSQI